MAMVIAPVKKDCPPWLGGALLPQVEECQHLGVLFMTEGRLEREIDRWIHCYMVTVPVCPGEENTETESETLNLPVDLCSKDEDTNNQEDSGVLPQKWGEEHKIKLLLLHI